MGTPDFAVPVLERLIKEHTVVCVYTRAPKEAGRGKQIMKTPVHLVAERYGIEVRTPKTLRTQEEKQSFADLHADVAVVAAYGLILPKEVIEACPKGCLNVHASLLPRWRGAAPIQRAVEAGDSQSGVTIMQVVEALDAGAMYKKGVVPITSQTTGGSLHDQLSILGADLMSEVLQKQDRIVPTPQDESFVTYAAKLDKSESCLDFSLPATILERKIRAFNPFPGTYFVYHQERFKVLEAEITAGKGRIGEILPEPNGLKIACKEGALKVIRIQRQGKKAMPVAELLKGFSFSAGETVEDNEKI